MARHVKIERIEVRTGVGADIIFDKQRGIFSLRFAEESVEADSLEKIRKAGSALLEQSLKLEFKPVIVVRLAKRTRRDVETHTGSNANRIVHYGNGVSFEYWREERAANPGKGKKGEQLRRSHAIDYEAYVKDEMSDPFRYNAHWCDKEERKRKGEARVIELRRQRAEFAHVSQVWEEDDEYVVFPYTEEAWVGLKRIDEALTEMQTKLDRLLSRADVAVLLTAAASPYKLLGPA
jgi:hypothetical protein